MTDTPVGSDAWARRQDAIIAIECERDRQDALWPDQAPGSPGQTLDVYQMVSILVEEVGEIAKAANEDNLQELHDELVQAGALCVKGLESLSAVIGMPLNPPPPPIRFNRRAGD